MGSGDPLMDTASNYLGSGDILSVKVLGGELDVTLICLGEMPCLKLSIGFLD